MSNQKLNYRKILTSERLPEIEALYFIKRKRTNEKSAYYLVPTNRWDVAQFKDDVEYWYEEYESREEELADLLEEALNLLDDFPYEQSLQERRANLTMNAQNLIWEIKNNAPKLLDDE